MVFLMMKTRFSKHVEVVKNWIKTLIQTVCGFLFTLHNYIIIRQLYCQRKCLQITPNIYRF